MKRLKIVRRTRGTHKCQQCEKVIEKGLEAIALVVQDEFGKLINYYCSFNCYDEYEALLPEYREDYNGDGSSDVKLCGSTETIENYAQRLYGNRSTSDLLTNSEGSRAHE